MFSWFTSVHLSNFLKALKLYHYSLLAILMHAITRVFRTTKILFRVAKYVYTSHKRHEDVA